jgi:Fe-S cluster biosynthesis and repair protein YggX
MDTVEVTLNLRETTLRKVRSLAMLTGTSVSSIEGQLSDLFDEMLSKSLREHLNHMDGVEALPEPVRMPKRSFAEIVQTASQPSVDDEAPVMDEHQLSSEEAEEGKSLEEQIEEEQQAAAPAPKPKKVVRPAPEAALPKVVVEEVGDVPIPKHIHAQDVGDNGDAFLDAAMAADVKEKPRNGRSAARTAFDARSPRVSIKSTSEDEDADFGFNT